MLGFATEHLITDQQSSKSVVEFACELAKSGKFVTFGIEPTSLETEYGYIESNGNEVIRFVKKMLTAEIAREKPQFRKLPRELRHVLFLLQEPY